VTHYETLGIPPATATDRIKERYRSLARTKHPDVGGSTEEFAAITEAGSTLSDPTLRAKYDAWMRLMMDPCPTCGGKGCTYTQRSFTDSQAQMCKACKGKGFHERRR
jgi:DnaJ-class molecular chaperone